MMKNMDEWFGGFIHPRIWISLNQIREVKKMPQNTRGLVHLISFAGWNCKYNSIFAEQIANKSMREANPFRSLVWVSTCKTWSLHLRSQGGVLNFDLVFVGIWILKLNIAAEVLHKIYNIQIFYCFYLVKIWFLFYRK